uniref:Uncharacterized protein n=1 Tax=Rhizophora mucronata TaxID=61149 RepID=A0A2P2P5Z7_RHIMU
MKQSPTALFTICEFAGIPGENKNKQIVITKRISFQKSFIPSHHTSLQANTSHPITTNIKEPHHIAQKHSRKTQPKKFQLRNAAS